MSKVAAELNLPSKGAADKRLFRLRKANDADGDGESGLTPKKHINANKRPLNEDEEDGGEGEHQFPAPTKKKRTKASPSKVKQAKGDGIDLGIKVEADA
ncbi:MAG: hypothetical protein M1828_002478 [Chrysothrix sp. TS-e1954]|nr:MAG: hypothetical protein M1828_002478 [Chrysothrix sp. TS-e1954]